MLYRANRVIRQNRTASSFAWRAGTSLPAANRLATGWSRLSAQHAELSFVVARHHTKHRAAERAALAVLFPERDVVVHVLASAFPGESGLERKSAMRAGELLTR